ncbi:helix-turn-helix domain-containing protein [Limosilactobacillus fastidiosus]|uniref:Helix-turn-helix transcriptional regulator n=1 Tax=Limosilactobacillus fastidiosus TaxID=2759855 RepID=A0A7W3TY44_9LACO|nr:helix-turn-helix transcriptional regulator [Limosilactobacillus fastidiosus]MBB1063163.1 helix-turn-helix transcriptional regulator [Limosilactobacillus fastidiosus]MBB1085421.1 helix-turn-helix transcriptional regulator [Limosilactobacillus fastidiosus]MCD7083722.1 helix-turn-helix transcriptional regulator [Limosilactobacillus fastidiosus]MCD7085403.1 helix-turn-helix transcriptional regulator [Limosilactobacillus fastidiosus]MCD7114832.1 helix-turn-helix transcriptional regulator [Limosi
MATFQSRLNQALKDSGLSQSELGRRSHIDRSVISGYIHGKYAAKQTNLYNLAKVLNVDEGWLMGVSSKKERQHKATSDEIGSMKFDDLSDEDLDTLINRMRSFEGHDISEAQRAALRASMKGILKGMDN